MIGHARTCHLCGLVSRAVDGFFRWVEGLRLTMPASVMQEAMRRKIERQATELERLAAAQKRMKQECCIRARETSAAVNRLDQVQERSRINQERADRLQTELEQQEETIIALRAAMNLEPFAPLPEPGSFHRNPKPRKAKP